MIIQELQQGMTKDDHLQELREHIITGWAKDKIRYHMQQGHIWH